MGFLDLIFPKKCLECGKEGKYICESCLNKVGKSGWYGNNYSVFRYEGVIRKAIIALKYKYSTEIAKELQNYIVIELKKQNFVDDYCLIPIPLHKKRFNERGFNQSEEVGKLIAKNMNWDFNANLLVKNRATIPQVGLKGKARRKNLSGVFSINPHRLPSPVHGSLVLFDDVFTTGSTLKEATKVLENAGYKNVWGLTIAR